ncbi:MAG: hypothetical protein WA399_21075, partial [Acidobacteriaceae bacterium]
VSIELLPAETEVGLAAMVTVGVGAAWVHEEDPQPLVKTAKATAEPTSMRSRTRLEKQEPGTRRKAYSFLNSAVTR